MQKENVLRVVLIVAASLAVSFVLAYSLLAQLLATNTDASSKQVALFSELIMTEIDSNRDALLALDSPSDYGSEAFNTLKETLDVPTWNS